MKSIACALLLALFSTSLIAATPGTWAGSADFGTLEIVVDAQGTGIEGLNLRFPNYTCGIVTFVGGGVNISWNNPVPITNDSFSIHTYLNPDRTYELTLDGTFNTDTQASGAFRMTVHGVVCDGTWEATKDGGVDPPTFTINAGLNDAWFNPGTDGQGFLIAVFEDSGVIFLAWFTFDVERPSDDVTAILGEPGHRWLTAQGTFSGDTATMDIYVTSGGVFDSAVPAPDDPVRDGTMTIIWTGCNAGVVSYDIPSLGLMGEIPIQRIVEDNVELCEILSEP